MKVHYVPKITNKIIEEIHNAKANNREIEFIELTDREMIQFKRELNSSDPHIPRPAPRAFKAKIEFMGVEIVKESPRPEEYFRGYGNREEF